MITNTDTEHVLMIVMKGSPRELMMIQHELLELTQTMKETGNDIQISKLEIRPV